MRSVKPAGCKSARTSKIPDDIAAKMASAANKDDALNHYFQIWMRCGRDWGRVQNEEQVIRTTSNALKKSRRWKTKKQLVTLYSDATVAEAIVEECMQDCVP
eukprot:13660710-Alexandrium_andersonii.AAC.1